MNRYSLAACAKLSRDFQRPLQQDYIFFVSPAFQTGPRKLVSHSLNTTGAQFLEFFIQLGGENDIQCFGIETREENILVQYSTNGGITWHLLKELQGPDYIRPRLVDLHFSEELTIHRRKYNMHNNT